MIISLLVSIAMAAGSTVTLAPILTNTIKKDDVEFMFSPKFVGGFQGEKKPCVIALHLSARSAKKFDKAWSTPVQYAISDGREGFTDVPGVSEFSVVSGEVRLKDTAGGKYVVDSKSGRLNSRSQPIVYGAKSGFILADVAPASIHEKLGLAEGDIVIAVNGVLMDSPTRVKSTPTLLKNSSTMNLIYIRNGQAASRDFELKQGSI